ncbi:MAG: hypothetical protein FWB71_03620 [Defluviitaleaceae bacterium]|nr:hypothetical protein [Defluviitaleaceae bacterium]
MKWQSILIILAISLLLAACGGRGYDPDAPAEFGETFPGMGLVEHMDFDIQEHFGEVGEWLAGDIVICPYRFHYIIHGRFFQYPIGWAHNTIGGDLEPGGFQWLIYMDAPPSEDRIGADIGWMTHYLNTRRFRANLVDAHHYNYAREFAIP